MSRSAGDVDYERTGSGYEVHRRADPRIAARVDAALGDAQTVLNVGAGAGSYEPAGRRVIAVEPSAAMRLRRAPGSAPVVGASAEALPFADRSVDAAMAIFTLHQWADVRRGLAEMRRVARGRVVIMTLDTDLLDEWWFAHYLPERIASERRRFPSVAEIAGAFDGAVTVAPVPVPADCTDGFIEAFYARPEALLDPAVRAAQSGWQFVDADVVRRGLSRLRADLASGRWDEAFGRWRSVPEWSGPLCLITA